MGRRRTRNETPKGLVRVSSSRPPPIPDDRTGGEPRPTTGGPEPFPCRPGSQKDTRRKATSEAERQHHTREEGATRLRTTTTRDTRRDRAGRSQSPAPIVGGGFSAPAARPRNQAAKPRPNPDGRYRPETIHASGSGGRNRDPAQSETGNRNRDTRCPANGNRDYRSCGWGVPAAPLNRPSGPRADGAGRRRTTRRRKESPGRKTTTRRR